MHYVKYLLPIGVPLFNTQICTISTVFNLIPFMKGINQDKNIPHICTTIPYRWVTDWCFCSLLFFWESSGCQGAKMVTLTTLSTSHLGTEGNGRGNAGASMYLWCQPTNCTHVPILCVWFDMYMLTSILLKQVCTVFIVVFWLLHIYIYVCVPWC